MIPNDQDVVDKCKLQNPQDWKDAHTGGPNTEGFIRKLVPMLRERSTNYGLNGKRGNPNDISDDAVNYLCDESDSAGRTPDGQPCVVIDVIFAAGAKPPYTSQNPAPRPQWGVFTTSPAADGAHVVPGEDGGGEVPVPPPVTVVVPGREEALDEMNYLHQYYKAPEGLQRPQGLWRDDLGTPDFEGIAAWYMDVYQQDRIKGKSRAEARADYVNQIRNSAEWKAKHPGQTP
jgi:hypothetical protein